jgi:hypothetical protein
MRILIPIFFTIFLFCSSCSGFDSPISIKGTINNFDEFETKNAFLQLVPLDPTRKFSVKEISAARNLEGNLVSIDYVSAFPKQSASRSFNYKMDNIQPGLYVLTIHTLRPILSKGENYEGPTLGRILFNTNNEAFIFEFTDNLKLPISIELGEVIIPSSDKIIIAEFENAKIIQQ